MIHPNRNIIGFTASAIALAISAGAVAQVAAPETPSSSNASDGDPVQNAATDIVVTGTSVGRTLLRTPYSISRYDRDQIERQAPNSIVDLLRTVPGISAEATGGKGGGENLFIRGLPSGGTFLVSFQHDGLTELDESQESFVNSDELSRIDLMTERVEAVVGGTSPIFTTNAVGATVNSITRLGSAMSNGEARVTVGSHNLRRVDGYQDGAISDRWLFSVGGFYRTDDGDREPGFVADKGGQITGTASLLFDKGRIDLIGRYTNDRNAFYTAIPLLDPRNGQSLASSLDPNYGTLASSDFRNVTLRSFYSSDTRARQADLADGIHTDIANIAINAKFEVGDGWQISNKFGLVDGSVNFNAIFSGAQPSDAAGYLVTALTKAKAGFGANVSRVGYVYANGDNASSVYSPATGNGLVIENGWYSVQTELRSLTNDLRLDKTLSLGSIGTLDITAGGQFQFFRFEQERSQNTILTTVQNQPRALDVAAYDGAGNLIGTVTDDGFVRYNAGLAHGVAEGSYVSPYAALTWHPVKALAIDGGVRHTWLSNDGENWTTAVGPIAIPGSLAGLVVGGYTGQTVIKRDRKQATSWTIGAQYLLGSFGQVFTRYTKAERLPRLQNAFLLQNNPINKVTLAEGGVKLGQGANFITATGFYSHFSPSTGNAIILSPTTNTYIIVNTIGETETFGGELAMNLRPAHWIGLNGNLTVQNPKQKSLSFVGLTSFTPSNNLKVAREPSFIINAAPSVFPTLFGYTTELSAQFFYVGDRFVDAANSTKLPAYITVGASARMQLRKALDLRISANNLTNSKGLTEGNPRIDSVTGQGSSASYARPLFGRQVEVAIGYKW